MPKHHYRLLVGAVAVATSAAFASAGAAMASAHPRAAARTALAVGVNHPAPAGLTPRAVGAVPLRVPNPAAYAAQKAAANAAAARLAARRSASPHAALAPSIVRNWAGQRDTNSAPSDSTGAIGTTRYI